MALIKCKECGEQVSDKAASCPKCGAPIAKKNKGPSGCMMVFFIFVGVLILLLFIGKVSNKKEAPSQIVGSTQVSTDKLKNDVVKEVEVKKEPVTVINWHNQPTKDSVTGEVGEIFYNTSKNHVNFPFPYNVDGGSVLNLVFRKRKQGTDAYVVISKGQIVCGYSDCSIRTKGDNGKVKTWTASSEASGRSDMIFLDNPQSFEKYIKSNKKITIGVTFYQSGEQGFDFDVSDYPEQAKKK
ncbi:TPA: zinc ribbon domain-containing protein [Citrobacter braakii]|uniref:zinc ribbon domain-containing protein n=1 Tax=Citrobacter portucalensis TaxID=1639133 RepID=UPI0009AC47C3|nr:zinc ribbon domain-containing protein [Citrobacter portucalensis]HCB1524079.1 zinc ribbon domain-containing protein [Citrobacter braakii]HCB1527037.1 zinc ribbon domain-containing protein [Citrobacter braakii]